MTRIYAESSRFMKYSWDYSGNLWNNPNRSPRPKIPSHSIIKSAFLTGEHIRRLKFLFAIHWQGLAKISKYICYIIILEGQTQTGSYC